MPIYRHTNIGLQLFGSLDITLTNHVVRSILLILTRQTQNICIIFIHCWTNVEDVRPTLYKCYTNVLCLLGSWHGRGNVVQTAAYTRGREVHTTKES